MIFDMIGIGFGAGLNYKVMGGTSAPNSPEENTIWVNTSAEITGHVFSTKAPEIVEGRVWIATGLDSPVPFNALKENSLEVFPVGCKQAISGTWVDKVAKTWMGNAWKDWITYLVQGGVAKNTFDTLKINGVGSLTVAQNASNIQVTLECSMESYAEGMWYTEVDLTGISVLSMTVSREDIYGVISKSQLAVWTSLPTSAVQNIIKSTNIEKGNSTINVDVSSLNGVHLVGIYSGLTGKVSYKITDFSY